MLELFTNLFPPEESSPEQTRQWRRSVSVAVIATGALTVANTWLMWGLFPVSLVFSGFATNVEAVEVQQLVKDIRVSQLENQLRELRVQQCIAQTEGNATALRLATSGLTEKGNAFWKLTGRVYTPESCDTLLIVRR